MHHLSTTRLPSSADPRIKGASAVQLVTVYSVNGDGAYYLFELGRQEMGELKGCWLTEGVIRLSPAQAAELRKKEVSVDI